MKDSEIDKSDKPRAVPDFSIKDLTVLIITFNEELNIGRTLSSLRWAHNILVIDSFSTDNTLKIIDAFSNSRVIQNKFVDFATQCNFGLSQIRTNWILSIDADYIISEELSSSIIDVLKKGTDKSAFSAEFKYSINGKPLRGSILPDRYILFKKSNGSYVKDGHAHRLKVEGEMGNIDGYVYHDDRKPLSSWFASQSKYVLSERDKILSTPYSDLSFPDKVRSKKYFAPFLVLVYCLIIKKGIFDGRRGWFYALQRVYFEVMLSLRLIDKADFGQDHN